MANEELKAAARDGQPKALEALINQSFGKQGITARVIKSGELLKVTLRSSNLPDQKTAGLVKKGIANIKPQGISKVSLKGEQIGGRESWTTEWNIAGDSPKVTTVVSSKNKKTPQWYFHPAVIMGGAVGALVLFGGLGSLVDGPKQPDAEAEVVEVEETPPEVDYLTQGKQQGYTAAVAAQNATDNQWDSVTQQWDTAISTLSQVPTTSPDYATAQSKISEYNASRDVAAEQHRVYQVGLEQAKAKAAQAEAKLGYSTYMAKAGLTGDTEVKWRWLENAETNCDYGRCWGMEVVAVEGCDNALYVELALEDDNDINVGMTNDTTGKVSPGQKARLTFNVFDESARSASLSEMSCY